jgi:hypothetical protein
VWFLCLNVFNWVPFDDVEREVLHWSQENALTLVGGCDVRDKEDVIETVF